MEFDKKYFAFIVPTGIGASVGGYAGDASFWARKFASIKPTIVNANVVNAACFSGINENILYAEGWGIDELFAGSLSFIPSENNKIGIIFDKEIPEDVLNIHINTINAVKTVYGVDVIGYEITKENVGVKYGIDESGASSGMVKNPQTLVEAGKILLEKGAQTLAVVCFFPENEDIESLEADKNYAKGIGVDPIGGVESIISHYVSQKLFVPCVHAPAFKDYQIKPELVDERAAAEYITPTFLPCLLLGLQNAPLYSHVISGERNFKEYDNPKSLSKSTQITANLSCHCERTQVSAAIRSKDINYTNHRTATSCYCTPRSDEEAKSLFAVVQNDEKKIIKNVNSTVSVLEKNEIIVHNICGLIVPSTALGSSAVFDALENNIPVYAVKENKTVLNVTKDAFLKKNGIIEVETYNELYKKLRQKYEKR